MSQVGTVLQFILIMPVTNATSERSFSTLRRVKTYLHITQWVIDPTKIKPFDLMLLHVHKERVDSLQLECVANDLIQDSEHRLNFGGRF